MNRRLVCPVAAGLSLVLAVTAIQAFAQGVAKPEIVAVRKLAAVISSNYQASISGLSDCKAAGANPATRRVWAARLGCSDAMALDAGLRLAPLTSAAPIPGARVVATFEVTRITGQAALQVIARKHGQPYGANEVVINKPGTYTVRGRPFTMEANEPFDARGEAHFGPCSEFCGIAMRIVEIKWEF